MKKFLLMLASLLGIASIHAKAQFVAYQDIKPLLKKLKDGQMSHGFFGLTSNGTDCLYFSYENGGFLLEYEVMVEPQKQVASTFMSWAKESGFEVITTTFGNKCKYPPFSNAPVYRVILGNSLDHAYRQGFSFFLKVFGYKESQSFEVVP